MYQTTGGAKSVTREEMRAFKKVWAGFANPRTELLERALPSDRRAVIDIDHRVRNWAVSLKFESTRLSLVFGTYWLLVGMRPIPTLGGGLAPDLPTALTSGYWVLHYRESTTKKSADVANSSAACTTKRSSFISTRRGYPSLICSYFLPTTS